MKIKSSWKDRYTISISEELTIKDIMALCNCGQSKASTIRNTALAYCRSNGIEVLSRAVPTEAVLMVIKHDIKYYYDKMMLEAKIVY